jgi:hypothetical protein
MKENLIFKNLIAIVLAGSTMFLASCVKDRNTGATDFSQLSPIVQITEGGMAKYSSQSLLFPASDVSDTAYFTVNYAATNVAPSDISVTLAYDAAALAAYNAANPTAINAKFPDSIYRFTQTSVVIKKGQNYSDPIKLTVFPYKVDPSKNYMFPISITDAGGNKISGNFGTIYFHFIGNPLAGTYNNVGTRYNYTGVVGYTGGAIPGGYTTAACGTPKVLAPLSSTVTTTYYANLGAGTDRDYYFSYDPAVSLTNVGVDFTQSFKDGISNIGVFIHTYDPVLRKIHILSTYNNLPAAAGADRIVEETMTHQ